MMENTKMKEKLRKNDFVEIEYTGKIKDTGQIFDTNVEKEAKKLNLNTKIKPLTICLGENMILPAIDDFLVGKEVGKSYTLTLPPEKAFGERKRELIKIMPLSVFRGQNITPKAGMMFSFDGLLGKISAVSGGRVIVDFNNPVAGKKVVYELKIKRKIKEMKEKVKALMLVFFKKEFPFDIKEKKLILKSKPEEKKFIQLFKEKFKEILGLDLEVKEKKNVE